MKLSEVTNQSRRMKLSEVTGSSKEDIIARPEFQGGAESQVNLQAQQGQKDAEFGASPLGVLKAVNMENISKPDVVGDTLSSIAPAALTWNMNPLVMLGKASGVGKTISNIGKYSKPQNQVKLADEVQNALMSQKRGVMDKYGKEYESIIGKSESKVNLNEPVKNFVDEAQSLMQNPEFVQQVAAKNPQATKILDMVNRFKATKGLDEVGLDISAKEADSLSRYIRNMPGIKSKLNQASKQGWHTVQWSNEDRMLLNLADDIKGTVVEAHPELLNLNKEYGQFMNAYKKVSPDFKIGNTVSKLKEYSSYDPQKQQLLEGILPKDTIGKIKEFESADKTYKVLKNLGLIAGGGALTGAGIAKGGDILRSVTP